MSTAMIPPPPFRGVVTAVGFLLDVPVIGEEEAAERVLALWQDGATLHRLPYGAWLLSLPAPVEVRADRAPGLPLTGRELTRDEVVLPYGGREQRHRLAGLTAVDPAAWLDTSSLMVSHLVPVEAELAADPLVEGQPVPVGPDLRTAARVRTRSPRRQRLAGQLTGARPDGSANVPRVAGLVLVIGALLLAGTVGPPGLPALLLLMPAVAAGGVATRRRRTHGGVQASTAPPGASRPGRAVRLRTVLIKLVGRTPAATVVRGRHARYLRALTEAFEQGRWDDALRDAIAISAKADSSGMLTLRLPARRTGELLPTPVTTVRSSSAALSRPTVHGHLRQLYREGATRLEREGRIEEAAFVLADLLGAAADAVALLERSGRMRLAAELAEGRQLPAELVVRLWWRAGERDRAVRLAALRGVFARTVERLAALDPASARELRASWVRACQEAGDRRGAIEAAWPEESLRPMILGDLRDAVALGGRHRSRALPYLLAMTSGEASRSLARAVLDGPPPGTAASPDQVAERQLLASGLAQVPCQDPATDRELATAAARAVVRDGGFGRVEPSGDPFTALLRRADPLTAADLPAPRPRPARPEPKLLELIAPDRPGELPVFDAVALDARSVLVACGEAGVRLLAPDGRVRARWDVPAHQLVVADHGTVVMLAARYGEVTRLARLDLATRAVKPWTTLRVRQLVSSFDGRLLLTVDEDGLTVLDTLAARPTVVRREPDRDSRIVGRVARTRTRCSAIVESAVGLERWRWDLPGWELRSRLPVKPASGPTDQVLLADGTLLTLLAEGQHAFLIRTGDEFPDDRFPLDGDSPPLGVIGDGTLHAVLRAGLDGTALVEIQTQPKLRGVFPDADPAGLRFRCHRGTATFWHRDGRVLAAAADGSATLAVLRTTVRT